MYEMYLHVFMDVAVYERDSYPDKTNAPFADNQPTRIFDSSLFPNILKKLLGVLDNH